MNDRLEYDEVVYEGKIATVHKIGLRMGDGQVVQRDFFHYNNAATILPVLEDGSVVMIRNYRFAVNERLWELPAGIIEGDEDPAACAARELIEETGYTAGKLEKLGQFYLAPGSTDELMHGYLATELTPGQQELEVYEEIEVQVLPEAEVRAMAADGRIRDGKTLALLGLYWLGKASI